MRMRTERPSASEISAHALRSVEHRGGLDAFLIKAREDELSQNVKVLRRDIIKKVKETQAA